MHESIEGPARSYLVRCSRCALARVVEVDDAADYALVMGCCGCGRSTTLELGAATHRHVCPDCGATTSIHAVQGVAA